MSTNKERIILGQATKHRKLPDWLQDVEDFCEECILKSTPRDKAADMWIEHASDMVTKIRQLMADNEMALKIADEEREKSCAFAHVIIESGTIPGIAYLCRCDECRSVARMMDEAGYLERQKDRWWTTDQQSPKEPNEQEATDAAI